MQRVVCIVSENGGHIFALCVIEDISSDSYSVKLHKSASTSICLFFVFHQHSVSWRFKASSPQYTHSAIPVHAHTQTNTHRHTHKHIQQAQCARARALGLLNVFVCVSVCVCLCVCMHRDCWMCVLWRGRLEPSRNRVLMEYKEQTNGSGGWLMQLYWITVGRNIFNNTQCKNMATIFWDNTHNSLHCDGKDILDIRYKVRQTEKIPWWKVQWIGTSYIRILKQ